MYIFMGDFEIGREVKEATLESGYDGVRDTAGIVELIAYYEHLRDLGDNQEETLSWEDNRSHAQNILIKWAKAYNKNHRFDYLGDTIHDILNAFAHAVRDEDMDHWKYARETLTTRVMNSYYRGDCLA
jgi:hypothetical protein